MKDIDGINKRVSSLEYYSSLSLLETAAKNLTLKNDLTGLDRFKNGIFVDNFETTSGANLGDSEYSIGRNPVERSIVPSFTQFKLELDYDTNINNSNPAITKTGDVVSLNFTESVFLNQKNATRNRSLTEGFYNWHGTMATSPTYDSFVDVRIQPVTQTVNNITNVTNNTTQVNNNTTQISNYQTTTVINDNNQPVIDTLPSDPPVIQDPPPASSAVDPVQVTPDPGPEVLWWNYTDENPFFGGTGGGGAGVGRDTIMLGYIKEV
jgi:hypothetical protein